MLGKLFSVLVLGATVQAGATPMKVVLRLKEQRTMEELARDVQDPTSPRYHHYYSTEEIRAIAAPKQEEYDALVARVKASGLQVLNESPTHLWLTVEAERSVLARTFSTAFVQVGALQKPTSAAQVPSDLGGVAAVLGLDNTRRAQPRFVRSNAPFATFQGTPPATIRKAYEFESIYASGLTGKGQHIAIATYLDFNLDDVQNYYADIGLKPVPQVDKVTFNGEPDFDTASAGETQLDAEFSGMIAPGASIHVFTSASNNDTGEAEMFTAILDDGRAKIINYSWGDCETRVDSDHKTEMEKIYARAVAQGVNILVATGDTGSDSCNDHTLAADWPASNPNIVAVGGTSMKYNGRIHEKGWSGSGGGISRLFERPDYQKSLPASFNMRSYPDVAFNADPQTGQAALVPNKLGFSAYEVVGGTSMAAPQWAGFLALVGEARERSGRSTLGFLPPQLYSLSEKQKQLCLNDVTSGKNGAYTAGTGWDAVTGLGSMRASHLLQRLNH